MQKEPEKTILVIENDPGVCELLHAVLKDDYEVSVLHSAIDALRVVKHVRPDVVLCAGHLPMLGGYELAACLSRDSETVCIPVIVMSPWEDGICEDRARCVGAAAFLPKPFLLSELREVIARHAAQTALVE